MSTKHFLKTTKEMKRKGYCRRCGRIKEHTYFHHFEYRAWAPWETVIEVCWNCHVDLDKSLQKKVQNDKTLQEYRKGWVPIKTSLVCYFCFVGLELQGEIPINLADGRIVSSCTYCNNECLTNRTPYQ